MVMRKFKGTLVLNWKNGEIPINIDIDLIVPDKQDFVCKGEIELSKTEIKNMMIERLSAKKEE